MRRRQLWVGSLLAVVLAVGMVVARVSAAESIQGDQCVVAVDETIDSDFYVACNTLTIEGTVVGDLIGGAWSAVVAPTGHIQGDIWLLGGQLRVDGRVEDDIHFAGVDLDLTASARLDERADITAVALNTEVWDGADVPGDLLVLGYQAIVDGGVEGDISFNGSALVIDGSVGGDVWAKVGGSDTSPSFIPFPFPFTVSFQVPGLTVRQNGQIAGNLTYSGPRPGNINGRIGEEINFSLVLPRPDITQTAVDAEEEVGPMEVIGRYLKTVLTDVLALMAAGILVMVVAPAWIREPVSVLPRHVASSFGWGLILALLTAPVALILILVSALLLMFLSTITLGGFTWMGFVLLLIVNVLVIGGLAFIILFLARLVISDVIGRRLSRRVLRGDRFAVNLASLLIGALIYSLLTNVPLPWVGLVLNAFGVFIGLGAIILHARQLYQRTIRAAYTTPAVTPRPKSSSAPALEALLGNVPPPPPDSTDLPGPGLMNLPNGFDWWKSERPAPPPDED